MHVLNKKKDNGKIKEHHWAVQSLWRQSGEWSGICSGKDLWKVGFEYRSHNNLLLKCTSSIHITENLTAFLYKQLKYLKSPSSKFFADK